MYITFEDGDAPLWVPIAYDFRKPSVERVEMPKMKKKVGKKAVAKPNLGETTVTSIPPPATPQQQLHAFKQLPLTQRFFDFTIAFTISRLCPMLQVTAT